MDEKLDFDATKLFEALKYQILVAMEYCHSLADGESLWVEVFGDVTVADKQQIEVKYYSDKLTDGHHNFWNTLNNWLKPEFHHEQYADLVLLTTQGFGDDTSLKSWDALRAEERLTVLQKIWDATEAYHAASEKSTASRNLKLQRQVFRADRRADLESVLGKMQIITDESRLMERIGNYKKRYLRALISNRLDDYMNDMFGFMTSPALITSGWQITSEAFTSKTRELTARYMVGTFKFPEVDHEMLEHRASQMDIQGRRFAQKLIEISASDSILDATVDLLHAEHYAFELIKDCLISESDIKGYMRNQYRSHVDSWRLNLSTCEDTLSRVDLHKKSQQFYLFRCSLPVEKISKFDFTPIEFRNGVYQMLADEGPGTRRQEFHWKMWE